MKKMWSEEEIQKIAEAAGGGVTPEDVKDILDGALTSDETTQALVDGIIYNYLELNPPMQNHYVHNVTIRNGGTSNFFNIEVTIINDRQTAFDAASLAAFLQTLGTFELNASGYFGTDSSHILQVFRIKNGTNNSYFIANVPLSLKEIQYSSVAAVDDFVYDLM